MSNQGVIDFKLVRLIEELERYAKWGAIPNGFVTGFLKSQDIRNYWHHLDADQQAAAQEILDRYEQSSRKEYLNLRASLVSEYEVFWKHCCTARPSWMFPSVMAKYRKNINPVRSLYYEMREIMFSYNPDNSHHVWLISTFSQPEFISQLIECTWKDKVKLDRLIDCYHPLFVSNGEEIPIELVHMIQTRQDLVEYVNLFNQFAKWQPDE